MSSAVTRKTLSILYGMEKIRDISRLHEADEPEIQAWHDYFSGIHHIAGGNAKPIRSQCIIV
jgi:hypothetical protein